MWLPSFFLPSSIRSRWFVPIISDKWRAFNRFNIFSSLHHHRHHQLLFGFCMRYSTKTVVRTVFFFQIFIAFFRFFFYSIYAPSNVRHSQMETSTSRTRNSIDNFSFASINPYFTHVDSICACKTLQCLSTYTRPGTESIHKLSSRLSIMCSDCRLHSDISHFASLFFLPEPGGRRMSGDVTWKIVCKHHRMYQTTPTNKVLLARWCVITFP